MSKYAVSFSGFLVVDADSEQHAKDYASIELDLPHVWIDRVDEVNV